MKKQFRHFCSILLTLAMIIGLLPVTASAAGAQRGIAQLVHEFTEEENALLEEDVFARIESVTGEVAQTMGGVGHMTEANYISMIPSVIAAIESSETYVEGSLQQNGNFLVWETTVGIPCCYDPRMEAELHNTDNDPTPEEVAAAEAEA